MKPKKEFTPEETREIRAAHKALNAAIKRAKAKDALLEEMPTTGRYMAVNLNGEKVNNFLNQKGE